MGGELILVLAVLAAGALPLARTIRRERRGASRVFDLGIAVGALVFLALAAATMRASPDREAVPAIDAREVHEDGYTGSAVCQACHPFQHATWHSSYHRSMTQLASPESVLAPFDGTELELEGMTWRPERRGDEFWVTGRPTGSSAGVITFAARVVMTTGSHNYQLYWLRRANEAEMSQFPMVYLVYERLWIPRKSRFLAPRIEHTADETGRWSAHCIKCHATRGRREAAPSGETRVAELGIACEACHGPGENHVRRNQQPLRRYLQHLRGGPDPTIVNAHRLAHDRSSEVCGQCHSLEIFLTQEKAQDWWRYGTRYRPGRVLSRSQTTVAGRYEDNPPEVRQYLDDRPAFLLPNCFWSDGVLRVAGREYNGLVESPCYKRGEMSCLSCHRMHLAQDDGRAASTWAEDQLGPGMDGDRACIQCHAKYDDPKTVLAHTHHRADSSGSGCYNCHMSYTTWGLLRAIRRHTVDSPDVANSIATGRPNACNQCHLDRTLQWSAEFLQTWYGIKPPELTEDERTVAASVLWTLRGDAVQRALMAWSMGWEPARQASGTDWMVPYLSILLVDSYDAVRFNAQRSLGRYPEYAGLTTSSVVVSSADEHARMMTAVLDEWNRTFSPAAGNIGPQLLFRFDGKVDNRALARFMAERDNTEFYLSE